MSVETQELVNICEQLPEAQRAEGLCTVPSGPQRRCGMGADDRRPAPQAEARRVCSGGIGGGERAVGPGQTVTSRVAPSFRRGLAALSASDQAAARRAYRQFTSDPFHHSMRFKKLSGEAIRLIPYMSPLL